MTKLYVGNLPFDATEDSVRALFAAHGTVEKLSLITDRDTGRPAADDKNPDPSLRTRPLIGLRIAHDMRPGDTPDKWTGLFYNSDDGQTYRVSLTLTAAGTLRAPRHWERLLVEALPRRTSCTGDCTSSRCSCTRRGGQCRRSSRSPACRH